MVATAGGRESRTMDGSSNERAGRGSGDQQQAWPPGLEAGDSIPGLLFGGTDGHYQLTPSLSSVPPRPNKPADASIDS